MKRNVKFVAVISNEELTQEEIKQKRNEFYRLLATWAKEEYFKIKARRKFVDGSRTYKNK